MTPYHAVSSAKMVTFAETVIVDYRLSFADQGKQTSVFHFHLQQTNGSLPFKKTNRSCRFPSVPFSVHILYMY
jgi:hypothetical protein